MFKDSIFLAFILTDKSYTYLKEQHLNLYLSVWLKVEDNGFEPLTPCVQGRCSSQLS
jgi:hypothetical protein